MAYYVPPSEKVGGHVLRVPHQIAPIKLRKSELNAWNKCCTGFSQYFTACVVPVFCFYVYVK